MNGLDLLDFLLTRMRMSHVYQPVMLKALIQGNGRASLREISAAFLALDQAQLDYYEEIIKRMPGPVLTRHGLVERDGDGYRLKVDLETLTEDERAELVAICDAKVEEYLRRRGDRAYDHRRTALGDLSGTVRYEVLKRAGFRCELCGSPADEKALEVDHILPRKHGGRDLLENLQALCWQCNANKGDRDATDFRAVRGGLQAKAEGCIFCESSPGPIIAANSLAISFRDAFPVTRLHTLIVPRRHAATWFDLTDPERRAISILLDELRKGILEQDRTVLGFNVGMNCGEVAGQTVHHAHVHLIPRRRGDVEEPRGGVRGVIPGKQSY
ncbi:HIT domain-containing protein [Falsiroseomonas sp. E2-1-a20]|uniref:HIT domain-containing protein n=1 Tax=Falsiroseomonas sp. E2-1-a20 TaxID=3239300 RepID=UPI003F2F9B5F